jgi:secondary thiamine-phosphate synthase enzyme
LGRSIQVELKRQTWLMCGTRIGPMSMRQQQKSIEIATRGEGLYEITDALAAFVRDAGIATGLVTAFCGHTSCSLILNENADPDVRGDLIGFFRRIAPQNMDWIVHRTKGRTTCPPISARR